MAEGLPRNVADYMAAHPPAPVEVWACNRRAYDLFAFLRTQWRVGMGGLDGLVYSEAYRRLDELGIRKRRTRLRLIDDLRIMETAVLNEIARRREAEKSG